MKKIIEIDISDDYEIACKSSSEESEPTIYIYTEKKSIEVNDLTEFAAKLGFKIGDYCWYNNHYSGKIESFVVHKSHKLCAKLIKNGQFNGFSDILDGLNNKIYIDHLCPNDINFIQRRFGNNELINFYETDFILNCNQFRRGQRSLHETFLSVKEFLEQTDEKENFISEDGVKIYKDMSYYCVIMLLGNYQLVDSEFISSTENQNPLSTDYLRFSTKKAALEFIEKQNANIVEFALCEKYGRSLKFDLNKSISKKDFRELLILFDKLRFEISDSLFVIEECGHYERATKLKKLEKDSICLLEKICGTKFLNL